MISPWEPRIVVLPGADRQRVPPIIEGLQDERGEERVRPDGHDAWRIDLELDPTDDPATAWTELERLLGAIDENWDEVVGIEAEPPA
jgi:hypothetical protein